jgi:hypothetical protein
MDRTVRSAKGLGQAAKKESGSRCVTDGGSARPDQGEAVLRRVVITTVAAVAALSLSAPAFADGIGKLVDQVTQACQNVKDGNGSCP